MGYTWRGSGLTYIFVDTTERDQFVSDAADEPFVSNVVVNGLTVTLDYDSTVE